MSSNQISQPKFIEEKLTKVNGEVVIRRYQKIMFLGKGGFATCYLCENTQTRRRYAIKMISKSTLTRPKTKQKLLSEIRIHKSLSHKNIVQFYHVFQDQYYVCILLQICSAANMFQLLRNRKKLTIPQAIYYIYQLIQALSYLHNNMIIHRDVKLGNLFINDKMELKLGDFGLATKLQFVGEKKRSICGTPNYIAPEIIQNLKGHSYQVDIWGTGVILYIFLNGYPPFETSNLDKTYTKIKNADFKPMNIQKKNAIDLIRKVLVIDPAKRITFKQFLQHPFMNPQGGILKTLPLKSLTQVPNLKKYEKYSDEEMKLTRNISVSSLKSQNQCRIQNIQERYNEQSTNLKKSAIFKSFKCLIAPTAKIQRSNSIHLFKNNEQKKIVSKSKQKELIDSNQKKKKNLTLASVSTKKNELYIYKYKIQTILCYAMTNGMIGTYEPKLKILYSKKLNNFYEITDNDTLKVIPAEKINQDIQNRRKKFFVNLINEYEQQENFKDLNNIVYVKKVLKTQKVILFKFSNNILQASFTENENIMLITQQQIILIPKGNTENMIRQKKENYLECKKLQLIRCYRMIIEIMNRSK